MADKAKPIPRCLAIIVCESVIEDNRSHNKSLLNIFNQITAPRFPCQHDKLTVFVSLTDGHGKQNLVLKIVRMAENSDGADFEMFRLNGVVHFRNPIQVIDLVLELRSVPFDKPGNYSMQIWIEDHQIGERRIHVKQEPDEEGHKT